MTATTCLRLFYIFCLLISCLFLVNKWIFWVRKMALGHLFFNRVAKFLTKTKETIYVYSVSY